MPEEIIWGGKFERMIHFDQKYYTVDYSKFNSIYNDNCTKNISAKQLEEQTH
jgi:hypothetical protein